MIADVAKLCAGDGSSALATLSASMSHWSRSILDILTHEIRAPGCCGCGWFLNEPVDLCGGSFTWHFNIEGQIDERRM